jgi:small-conductance mechanosensitive channel
MKKQYFIVILFALSLIGLLGGFRTAVAVQTNDIKALANQSEEDEDKYTKEPVNEFQETVQRQIEEERARLAEEGLLIARERAKLAEEKLEVVQRRATTAEARIGRSRNNPYTKLLQTGLILLAGYSSIFILVYIINRRIKDLRLKHLARKNIVYVLHVLIILYIFFLWVQNISSLTIFLSIISAGIALALQEVILSMAGWLLILVRRPFHVGDRIELGGVKGDVIDIRFFQTSLLEIGNWVNADQSTGRIVHIPNSAVFKQENFNYSRGFEFIWNELKILITFESDWKRAEEIMLEHAVKDAQENEKVVRNKIDHMTKRYMIHYGQLTPIVYVDIKDSGVEVTLRYLTEARKRRTTQDALCRAILDDFEKEENVNFAYPTYRIVMNEQHSIHPRQGLQLSQAQS